MYAVYYLYLNIKSGLFLFTKIASRHSVQCKSSLHYRMTEKCEKFSLPERYRSIGTNVWEEYIKLAEEYNSLNLGPGFPDFAPPKVITDALKSVVAKDDVLLHQYTGGTGHKRLLSALSNLYSKLTGRTIHPFSEILITAGAYEALYCTIQGHIHPGDEVIIIEPYFDCYESMVVTAGGIPRFIPLKPKDGCSGEVTLSSDWIFDEHEMESIFNEKTKAVLLNTPHNPLGKVFSEKELSFIANLCKRWNVLCISDEVYEWMVYEPYKHIRIASFPDMWERTITIGSAGKTFNVTGWKTGWTYGAANLIRNLQIVHQNSIYTCCSLLQEAIAIGFEIETGRLNDENCYFNSLTRDIRNKRDFLGNILRDSGLKPVIPQGGYLMIADWSPLEPYIDLSSEKDEYKDYRFTKWMTKKIGIQGIPVSAFYSIPHKYLAEKYVRYCFMKKEEKLQKAAKIFKTVKAELKTL